MTPHVPKPQRGSSVRDGFFRKDEFRYDPTRMSTSVRPGRFSRPHHEGKLRDLKKIDYSNPAACPVCPLRSRCTNDFRKVSRLENEAALDRMAARLKARPDILDRRREIVEHPFGSIKQWMYQGAFLMHGLENVRAEFSLTALAYNLRAPSTSWPQDHDGRRSSLRQGHAAHSRGSAPPGASQVASGRQRGPNAHKFLQGSILAPVHARTREFSHGLLI